jgi:hypothetical protein
MTAYLPIVLGQDALQWLRHLPRHCIDDWSDFSRRFTTNFQSLSDKPAQPWDLKSIKRRGDKTLRSYLKRFQTMRNRIPEVEEAAVIEDFYRGPMTRPSFEPYYRRRRPLLSSYSGRPNSTSPPTNELKTSSEEQSPHRQHHDVTRTSSPTNAGRRGLVKKSTPLDLPPLAPEEDLTEANARWTTSSTPSARTTKTCATPSGTAETSSIPWGTADPSNLYLLPRREEDQENRDNPSGKRREEVEPSRALTEKSMSSSADTGRKKARDNKSSTIVRYWWRLPILPPRTDGLSTRSPSPGQISGSTSTTQASTRSSSIW